MMNVNRRLLPLKAYYFFNYGAAGSLLPLIMVHLKQLGMTTIEAGFIIGITQLCSIIFRPLSGLLADKYNGYKTLLLFSLLLFGCGYFSCMFIPVRIENTKDYTMLLCSDNTSQTFNTTHHTSNNTRKDNLYVNISDCDYRLVHVKNKTTIDRDLVPLWSVDWTAGLALVLFSLAKVSYSSHQSLLDTITYFMLHPKWHLYSRQRLWGTIGTIFSVSSIIYVVNIYFNGIFYVFLGFVILAFIAGLSIEVNVNKRTNSRFFSVVKSQISDVHRVLFSLKILFFGIFLGSTMNFLFWYLKDIGIPESFLAIIVLINCVSSVCVHQLTPTLLKLCGADVCMYFSLGAYALRFVGYSFVYSQWYIIPLELLHGLTYSLLWSSISSKVSLLSPDGSQGTLQGIAGAIYNDLGRGLGAISTGCFFQIFDTRWLWRYYAASCLILLVVFIITDRVWPVYPLSDIKEEVVTDLESTTIMLERPSIVKEG